MEEVEIVVDERQFMVKALERANGGDLLLIYNAIEDIRDFIERTARLFAPKRTGRLAEEGIDSRVQYLDNNEVKMEVGLRRFPEYGILVHEGTGLFGSFHRPITPNHSNVLQFSIAGRHIYARAVAGQPPQPFIQEAVLAAENTYIPARIRMLGERISRV